MNTWKRLISLALCLTLCLIALQGKAGAATQLTEEEYASKIAYLRTVYKHGEYWSRNNTSRTESNVDHTGSNPCNGDGSQYNSSTKQWGTCGSFVYNGTWYAGQCYGYALKMQYEIFGSNRVTASSNWERNYTVSEFFAGDHVRLESETHSILITSVNESTVTYTDCNKPGQCIVNWDRTISVSSLLSKVNDKSANYVEHRKGSTLKGTGTTPAPEVEYNFSSSQISGSSLPTAASQPAEKGSSYYANLRIKSGTVNVAVLYITPPGGSETRFERTPASGTGSYSSYIYTDNKYTFSQSGIYKYRWHITYAGNTKSIDKNGTFEIKGSYVKLNVNGYLDGQENSTIGDYGLFDVYVNGKCIDSNRNGCYDDVPVGGTYEIKNIRPSSGYLFHGAREGSLTGTAGTSNIDVRLIFRKNIDVGTGFYAKIISKPHNLALTNTDDQDVVAQTQSTGANQIWYFERQSGGFYKIRSEKDGRYLDVYSGGNVTESNVHVHDGGDYDTMLWAIHKTSDSGVYLLGVKSTESLLDINGASKNIHVYPDVDVYTQLFTIQKLGGITVTLNPNNGNVSPTSISVTYGGTYANLTTPTRMGYTFAGWYTAASGGTQVTTSTKVTATGNHTLYARWTTNKYTVTLNPNNGNVSPTSISVTYGETCANLPTPTRTGYTFAGWYTAASGGSQVTTSTKVTATSNHTLYARWTANKYTVTLNPNDGSVSPTSISVTYDGTYANLPTPTREWAGTLMDYRFEGWYTAASGGTQVTTSTKVTATSNHTLYARWIPIYWLDLNSYLDGAFEINTNDYGTFDVYINGSLVKDNTADYYDAWTSGTTYEIKDIRALDGYVYNGVEVGAIKGTIGSENIEVALSFSTKDKYTVTLDPNGGSVSPTSIKATYAGTYSNLPTNPTRTGYTFNGWYTAKDGGTQVTTSTKMTATENHTLYAHWTQAVVPVTSVTLNKTALSLTAGDSETLTATVAPDNATNKAVTWTTSDASVATVSGGKVTAVGAGTATIIVTTVDGNKTATCEVTVNKPVQYFQITFSANGGSGTIPTLSIAEGGSFALPTCAFTAPSGKQFKAWSVGGKEYVVGEVLTATADTTVSAVWEDLPVSDAMRVSIESKTAGAGETVDLAIKIENNLGIAMTQFKVAYDAALTLESVEAGNVFAPSEMMMGVVTNNPYTVMFFSTVADRTDDGTLATLHFRVNETAEENSVHAVSISGMASNILENQVETAFTDGSVTIRSIIYGDVNGDGEVNGLDVLRLGKFLTGWNVTFDEATADVNGDGEVNGLDQLRLAKYCAGWPVTLGK